MGFGSGISPRGAAALPDKSVLQWRGFPLRIYERQRSPIITGGPEDKLYRAKAHDVPGLGVSTSDARLRGTYESVFPSVNVSYSTAASKPRSFIRKPYTRAVSAVSTTLKMPLRGTEFLLAQSLVIEHQSQRRTRNRSCRIKHSDANGKRQPSCMLGMNRPANAGSLQKNQCKTT